MGEGEEKIAASPGGTQGKGVGVVRGYPKLENTMFIPVGL